MSELGRASSQALRPDGGPRRCPGPPPNHDRPQPHASDDDGPMVGCVLERCAKSIERPGIRATREQPQDPFRPRDGHTDRDPRVCGQETAAPSELPTSTTRSRSAASGPSAEGGHSCGSDGSYALGDYARCRGGGSALAAAVLGPLAVAAALVPFRAHLSGTNSALILVHYARTHRGETLFT